MSSTLDNPDPWDAFATEFRRSVAEYASDRGFRELVIGSVTGSLHAEAPGAMVMEGLPPKVTGRLDPRTSAALAHCRPA